MTSGAMTDDTVTSGAMTDGTVTNGETPVIRVDHVSRWFGSVVAVSDITFDINPGITGLLGPNGAGKTTLLRMITGLADVSDGEVTVFGQPARDNPALFNARSTFCEKIKPRVIAIFWRIRSG